MVNNSAITLGWFLKLFYLFLVALGLRCCAGFSPVLVSQDISWQWPRLLRSASSRAYGLQQLQCVGSWSRLPGSRAQTQ